MENTEQNPVPATPTPADQSAQVDNFAYLAKQMVIDQIVAAIEMTKKKAAEEISLMETKLQEFRDKPISHFTTKFLEKVKIAFPFVLDLLGHYDQPPVPPAQPKGPAADTPVMP